MFSPASHSQYRAVSAAHPRVRSVAMPEQRCVEDPVYGRDARSRRRTFSAVPAFGREVNWDA